MRGEIDPAADGFEVGIRLSRLAEAAVGAHGEGHQRQPRVVEPPAEVRRTTRVGADHRIGDLDPGVAAIGDRRHQLVGPAGPGVAQHLPGERLATELQRGKFHQLVLDNLTVLASRRRLRRRGADKTFQSLRASQRLLGT